MTAFIVESVIVALFAADILDDIEGACGADVANGTGAMADCVDESISIVGANIDNNTTEFSFSMSFEYWDGCCCDSAAG